jgi:hypothetical protein
LVNVLQGRIGGQRVPLQIELKTVLYKKGELLSGFEILEEAAARTKKKDPMPFDIQWETDEEEINLHIAGAVSLERKKK